MSLISLSRRGRYALIGLIGTLIMAACNGGSPVKDTSAQNLLPNLPDYTTNSILDIQQVLSQTSSGASLLTGNAPLAGAIQVINGVTACYQKAGAIEGRTYINNADATKAGVVFVVNKTALTSPENFMQCVLPGVSARRSAVPELTPCLFSYTLDKNNTSFYLAFAATDNAVCQQFCSAMEGCTGTF